MQTAQGQQLVVVSTLDTHRKPVDSCFEKSAEHLFVYALRIAFHGDLSAFGNASGFLQSGKQLPQPFASQQGRGSAAKINGIDIKTFTAPEVVSEMPLYRPDIPVHQTFILTGTGVKIAIRAFFPAEWYMDIDTQALPDRRLGRLFFAKYHNSSFSICKSLRTWGRYPACHTGLHSGCSVSVVTPCSGHGA